VRVGEHLQGGAGLDEFAEVEESNLVRTAGGLLKIVRDENDRRRELELVDEVLDLHHAGRIERTRRFVQQHHLGPR
jgi:hypothetical protein